MGRIVAVAIPPWGLQFPVDLDGRVMLPEDLPGRSPTGKLTTHAADKCAGEFCCLHNPSDHPLKDANMVLRLDKGALIERLCRHGVGHSDPDSAAWLRGEGEKGSYLGMHGCDGCCFSDEEMVPA